MSNQSVKNEGQRKFQGLPKVSIVVPCFNEGSVILVTHQRFKKLIDEDKNHEYEIIYVDDGSLDETFELLQVICLQSEHTVKVLRLSRNFGHQLALSAGVSKAEGRAVVIIDADLQDPPEYIPEMLKLWRDGADVVYGVRIARSGESRFKLETAKLFYRVINLLSDTRIPLDTGDFRLVDQRVIQALGQMPEKDRFIRGMIAWIGFKQVPLYYKRDARLAGITKYPMRKMLSFAIDGILSFSTRPLRIASVLGFVISFFSVFGILYSLYARLFTSYWVPGWTLLFIVILLIGGIQLIVMGIVGEYIGRIYGEVKSRPLYFISDEITKADL
jgi:glycosyltransferase involved in cell wall biosynthesis